MYIPAVDTPRDTDRTDSGYAPASSNAVEAVPAVGCTSAPALSFVSRAKAVLHSAASRAKVFTESRAESRNDRGGDGKAKKDAKKADDQKCSGDDGFIKSREEIPEAISFAAQDAYDLPQKLSIPPASILKQLTAAYDRNGNDFFYSKDLLSLVEDPLPTKEKPGLSFSSVKSLVLGEKDEKLFSDLSNDVELLSMMQLLFDSEKSYTQTNGGLGLNNLPLAFLPKDIRGAPPGSFVFKLSEIVGGFSSIHKMSAFWGYVIAELRRRWSKGFPVPWMPLDADPDLDSCLLHQQLQVINCCISRKLRRNAAIKSLESVMRKARVENKDLVDTSENSNSIRYARLVSGQYALRLGADHLSENLTMLETGEPIYSPVTQEGPILTEELIKENEELVLRTGSFGAGCSQLLSDMQAFKAANPGCVLEDFIRWHSPPDWTEIESTSGANDSTGKEGSSRRGRLSKRMLQEGNLWQELWKSAKALPAVQQTPVFDEDLAVESIFTTLEDIRPSELIEQLFLSMLCSAFAIVEASISPDSHVSRTFHECKDWVIAACQSGISSENIGDICKVYETVEMLITHPEEAITVTNQPEEATIEEPKSRFRRMNLNFIAKKPSKDEKKSEERQMRVFSQLFDTKYLFPKRQPKLKPASTSEPMPDVNDWTIV